MPNCLGTREPALPIPVLPLLLPRASSLPLPLRQAPQPVTVPPTLQLCTPDSREFCHL